MYRLITEFIKVYLEIISIIFSLALCDDFCIVYPHYDVDTYLHIGHNTDRDITKMAA